MRKNKTYEQQKKFGIKATLVLVWLIQNTLFSTQIL